MMRSIDKAEYRNLELKGPDYPEYVDKVRNSTSYLGEEMWEFILAAYNFANYFHQEHSPRRTGEPYISHPVEVACILASYHVDAQCIVAALLHDVYEDHSDRVQLEDISRFFGSEISRMVDGLTKISQASSAHRDKIRREQSDMANVIADSSTNNATERAKLEQEHREREKKARKAATVRKLIKAMATDLRVMMIKLADRIHNMRTLDGHNNPASQSRIAQETLDIFVPIASRLGAYEIKIELEDLSFKYVAPNEYNDIKEKVEELSVKRSECLEKTKDSFVKFLREHGIDADFEIKRNSLFYIYRKFKKSHRYEIDYIRIIVDDDDTCYRVMGILHKEFIQVNIMHDYLGTGKSNGYRALHTSIYGVDREVISIHICPRRGAQVNDLGIFAGYYYDDRNDDGKMRTRFEEFRPWLNSLLDVADSTKEDLDYIDALRGDLLSTDVLAFTPMGDPIDLPIGANPIDFAYRVHTNLGNTCVSAQVNGVSVDMLTYEIKQNDVVVIQSSHSATPRREWYNACRTSLARNRIRAWFSKGLASLNIEAGRQIALGELTKLGLSRLLNDDIFMGTVAKRFGQSDVTELFKNLGCWQISDVDFSKAVRLEVQRGYFAKSGVRTRKDGKRTITDMLQVVGGMPEGYRFTWMKCCSVILNDDIVGYLANNHELRVHRRDCPSAIGLRKLYPERFVQLIWMESGGDIVRNKVGVFIRCKVKDHIVGQVISRFDEQHEHICEYFYKEDDKGFNAEMRIYFKAVSVNQVNDYIKRLLDIDGVESAVRL